jgi:hypothetical protein
MSEWAGNRRCRKCEQKVNQEYIPKQFTDFNTETSDE